MTRQSSRLGAWLPRTLPGLVACGCLLTALPTLAALLLAGIGLDRLARDSDALVSESQTMVHLTTDLRDRLHALERNCRQFLVVQDAALLEIVAERWTATEAGVAQLLAQSAQELRPDVIALQDKVKDAKTGWMLGDRAKAADRLRELEPLANRIIAAGRQSIESRAESLRQSTREANQLMFLSTLLLAPLTVLLTFSFSRAVAKPLKQLSSSIAELGHGSYGRPIAIEFPQEMQRLGGQLDWLRRRLARLEADKDRFLQHVSHELKTPLASLSEGAQLLAEGTLGSLNRRQTEITHILCESAAELESSISTLLAYAEWRAERKQTESTWFEADKLIGDILAAHRLPMRRRQLRSLVQVDGERLFGQRSRLRIALDNLVTNAIKHAPEGSVIEVHARIGNGRCELSVRDSGSGVPDHEKEKIFEPFVRGSAATDSRIRGTGVGLSIVRETALAHGGEVSVQDAAPGANFRMAWPCPGTHA